MDFFTLEKVGLLKKKLNISSWNAILMKLLKRHNIFSRTIEKESLFVTRLYRFFLSNRSFIRLNEWRKSIQWKPVYAKTGLRMAKKGQRSIVVYLTRINGSWPATTQIENQIFNWQLYESKISTLYQKTRCLNLKLNFTKHILKTKSWNSFCKLNTSLRTLSFSLKFDQKPKKTCNSMRPFLINAKLWSSRIELKLQKDKLVMVMALVQTKKSGRFDNPCGGVNEWAGEYPHRQRHVLHAGDGWFFSPGSLAFFTCGMAWLKKVPNDSYTPKIICHSK